MCLKKWMLVELVNIWFEVSKENDDGSQPSLLNDAQAACRKEWMTNSTDSWGRSWPSLAAARICRKMLQMAFVFRTTDGPDFVAGVSRELMAAAGVVPLLLEAHIRPPLYCAFVPVPAKCVIVGILL